MARPAVLLQLAYLIFASLSGTWISQALCSVGRGVIAVSFVPTPSCKAVLFLWWYRMASLLSCACSIGHSWTHSVSALILFFFGHAGVTSTSEEFLEEML